MRCDGCGTRTEGYLGLCRACKGRRHRGLRRASRERLAVESVTEAPGSPWCAWDARGVVVAGPFGRKLEVLIELGT